ncbi:MAG: GAF domain-containing protein, partial [Deltaproteobacteria bacterium]
MPKHAKKVASKKPLRKAAGKGAPIVAAPTVPTATAAVPAAVRDNSATLLDVMRSLAAERDLTALLQKIMSKTSEVMEADRSTLFLVDEESQEIWSKVAQGEALKEIRVPMGVGIAGHVAKSGEIVNIADAYQDSRFNPEVDRRTGYKTKTILCMPMRRQSGKVAGVIQVLNKRQGVFTQQDEELLEAFASQAGIAVRNAMLNEEILKRMRTSEILLNVMRAVSSE